MRPSAASSSEVVKVSPSRASMRPALSVAYTTRVPLGRVEPTADSSIQLPSVAEPPAESCSEWLSGVGVSGSLSSCTVKVTGTVA